LIKDDVLATEIEIFAATVKETWNIEVKNADTGAAFTFSVASPIQNVKLVELLIIRCTW
jgi:hypothetical protein